MNPINLINFKDLNRTAVKCSCGELVQFCIEDLDGGKWVFLCKTCLVKIGKRIIDELGN